LINLLYIARVINLLPRVPHRTCMLDNGRYSFDNTDLNGRTDVTLFWLYEPYLEHEADQSTLLSAKFKNERQYTSICRHVVSRDFMVAYDPLVGNYFSHFTE
jgi:hypothetical protein